MIDLDTVPFRCVVGHIVHQQPDVPPERLRWIYEMRLTFHWDHRPELDDKRNSGHRHCRRDAEGRCENSIAWDYPSPKKVEDLEELRRWLIHRVSEWFNLGTGARFAPSVANLRMSFKLKQVSEWWCRWFSHECVDVGQSDAEAVESFERYVRWVESLPKESFYPGGEPREPLCLMGAEDRWRWRAQNDEDEERRPPPCRCAGCKKAGLIRINH